MVAQVLEHPESPFVSLRVRRPLTAEERIEVTAANAVADPAQAWHQALLSYRLFAIQRAREELLKQTALDDTVIRHALDMAWQAFFPAFHKATGPMIAEAYIRAFRSAGSGDVPIKVIYALAEEHSRRVGDYFNETSNEALIRGFNTYVNRKVPAKAALERVIDAYGLTPRQMSGFTSATALDPMKMETAARPQSLKARAKAYVAKSIKDRLGIFTRQEAHNLDEQASQMAWAWMVEHNKLPETAQKMWLTAHDEKVCAACGPMHRKKVKVTDRFVMPDGQQLYVPGAHTNCRCTVRLQINLVEIGKAEEWDESKVKRGGDPENRGRFSRKADESPFLRRARRAEPMRTTEFKEPEFVDPRVEHMLREAQREQEQREHEEALARLRPTIPAKPTITAKPKIEKPTVTKPTISGKPTVTAKPTVGRPIVEAAEEAPVEFAPSARPADIRLEQVKAEISAATRPQVQVAADKLFDAWAKERAEREAAITPRTRRVYRPTVPFHRKAYSFGNYWSVDTENTDADAPLGRVTIEAFNEFIPADLTGAEKVAVEALDKNVNQAVEVLMESGANVLYRDDPREPDLRYPAAEMTQLTHTLDKSDLYQIVSALAHPKWAEDQRLSLEWDDEDDMFSGIETRPFIKDLARDIGVTREELEVIVYELDEGYEGTTEYNPGSKYGYEMYTAPGVYKIVGERSTEEFDIPMRIIRLEPIVEERVIEDEEEEAEIVENPWLPHDRQ